MGRCDGIAVADKTRLALVEDPGARDALGVLVRGTVLDTNGGAVGAAGASLATLGETSRGGGGGGSASGSGGRGFGGG